MSRQFSVPVFSVLILAGGIFGFGRYRQSLSQPSEILENPAVQLKVELPEVVEGLLPIKYTCEGEDINPALTVGGIPKNTKSLVLIVDDRDTAIGIFTHWMLWNLEPETKLIKEGETPVEAIVGENSNGESEWGSICPPPGRTHRYGFKVYALSDYLNLSVEEIRQTDLTKATKGITLGYGEATAAFGK